MPSIEEIERLAMSGEGMPRGYTQPEQLLFLSLRNLHWEYRRGIVTREEAREEKYLLAQEFETQRQFCEIFQQAVRIRNAMSYKLTAAEKSGCPHCQELVRIFDGRQGPGDGSNEERPPNPATGAGNM